MAVLLILFLAFAAGARPAVAQTGSAGGTVQTGESSVGAAEAAEPTGDPFQVTRERIADFRARIDDDPSSADHRWQLARELMTLLALTDDRDDKKDVGRQARAEALSATALDPEGIEGHYWLAVATGALADLEGGRTRVRMADESWEESSWVLAADSMHAGAHHVKGRIHAGIMRAGGITRFLAKTLLGGDAIDRASWELAEYHLGMAAQLESTPMHHLELALMYGDTDRPEAMRRQMGLARDAVAGTPLDRQYQDRARRWLEEDAGGEGG
jgi:hypothetical protein